MAATAEELAELEGQFERELAAVVRFWRAHSLDEKHGGFYHCVGEEGERFDSLKYGWMQGRQVWMFAKLYNSLPQYHTEEMLSAAIKGADFLMAHVRVPGQRRCYFVVTEDGRPVRLQRKPYTECFYVMAMAEMHRATARKQYKMEAEEMFAAVKHWVRVDDSGLGAERLEGAPAYQELGRPMMLLNVLAEVCGGAGPGEEEEREKHRADIDWCVEAIQQHSIGGWVREHVALDGSALPGCLGRQSTPGHALEAGWFMLVEAERRGDKNLERTAVEQFMEQPFVQGWDPDFGGLFYFLDCEGGSPVQLEWPLKLWWVHCEALLAFLLAYRSSREARHWARFKQLWRYCRKFIDERHGEWYGYLTREGRINQTFKGGPYKGCFHVPRSLLLCLQTLRTLQTPPVPH